jgi:hypothetical protein
MGNVLTLFRTFNPKPLFKVSKRARRFLFLLYGEDFWDREATKKGFDQVTYQMPSIERRVIFISVIAIESILQKLELHISMPALLF